MNVLIVRLSGMFSMKSVVDKPADITGASGSFSLAARNDIRKGIKCISLMELRALFEVSLIINKEYEKC